MAKQLFKLLLHASLACCLAVGFSSNNTFSKGGFESVVQGEVQASQTQPSDADTPELWLLTAPLLLLIFALATLTPLAFAGFFQRLTPRCVAIRAPPVIH